MANLFSKAKKAAPKTTKAKAEKVRITISDPSFYDKIEKLESLNNEMKSSKAKADMLSAEIKDLGKDKWAELYTETGKNPGSVMLENIQGEDVAQVMFVPTDKYITINEDRANELIEEFGEDIVQEETTFSFDNKMIEKYGEVISELIYGSDKIDENDKEKIIKAVSKYSVAKGTIDRFTDFGDVKEIMETVRPVVSLKNVEVIRG